MAADRRVIEAGDPMAEELESFLRELSECYEQLRSLAHLRGEAIRRAEPDRLAACIAQENTLIQRVSEAEKRRLGLVSRFADRLGSPAKGQTAVSWIAERCAEPQRARLEGLASRLREAMTAVMVLNRSSKMAAERVSSHLDGVWRQVSSELSHSKTYGRGGQVATGASQVVSALDVGA
ncbi:MAG: flagellar export chaperone FlgN [Planctomycetota bacterium]